MEALQQFLNKYRVIKSGDKKEDKKLLITHTSLPPNAGSYNVPASEEETLYDLVSKVSPASCDKLTLVERPIATTYFKMDIDMRLSEPLIQPHRYSHDDIKKVVSGLMRIMYENFEGVNGKHMGCFVHERPRYRTVVEKGKTIYKDGYHLLFPDFICTNETGKCIRDEFIRRHADLFIQYNLINPIEDVIDASIYKDNGWILYGLTKYETQPYKLTAVYDVIDETFECVNRISEFSDTKMLKFVRKFANRNKGGETPLIAKATFYTPKPEKPLSDKKRKEAIKSKFMEDLTIEVTEVRDLLLCLSEQRLDNYDSWINVGQIVYNINPSNLPLWEECSKISGKYNADGSNSCHEKWNTFSIWDDKKPHDCLNILRSYAKKDNPEKYKTISKNVCEKYVMNIAYSPKSSNYAELIKYLYDDMFCISVPKAPSIWFKFNGVIWERQESNGFLQIILTNDLIKYFNEIIFKIREEKVKAEDLEEQEMRKKIIEVARENLRGVEFRNVIIQDISHVYENRQKYDMMDKNLHLLGFTNGVYDLEKDEFRPATREDNLTLTVGYDYVSEKNPEYEEAINKYMTDMFGKGELPHVMKIYISRLLHGGNDSGEFFIFNGGGSNGKTTFVRFLDELLGNYAGTAQSALFCQRQKIGTNVARPEIVALKGKRLVHAEEPQQGSKFQMDVIKEWTGGAKIQTRALYGQTVEFETTFKLVFSCNEIPELEESDKNCDGTWRRLLIMPFLSIFTNKTGTEKKRIYGDKETHPIEEGFEKKFKDWRQTFMLMILDTMRNHKIYESDRKKRLAEIKAGTVSKEKEIPDETICDEIKNAISKYRDSGDKYASYMEDRIEILPEDEYGFISLTELYDDFKDYETSGGKKAITRDKFKDYLINERKLIFHRNRKGGADVRGFLGIRFKENIEDDAELIDDEPILQ